MAGTIVGSLLYCLVGPWNPCASFNACAPAVELAEVRAEQELPCTATSQVCQDLFGERYWSNLAQCYRLCTDSIYRTHL
jgi:hypothetical protein